MENGVMSWPHNHKWVAQMYPATDVPSKFEAIFVNSINSMKFVIFNVELRPNSSIVYALCAKEHSDFAEKPSKTNEIHRLMMIKY